MFTVCVVFVVVVVVVVIVVIVVVVVSGSDMTGDWFLTSGCDFAFASTVEAPGGVI